MSHHNRNPHNKRVFEKLAVERTDRVLMLGPYWVKAPDAVAVGRASESSTTLM